MPLKNKINKNDVRQVKLDFTTVDIWLATRPKLKDSRCENCGRDHEECKGNIALAVVSGRVNAHLCEDCGKYFIHYGSQDINVSQAKYNDRKEKLLKQAKRLGVAFDTYFGYKTSDMNVEKLTDIIKTSISNERKNFHKFLNIPEGTKEVLDSFVECLNKENEKQGYRNNITAYDVYQNPRDYFYEYDTEISRDSHRWLDYLTVICKVYDKTFSWGWATCTGDNSIWDQGFEFDFDTLIEIPPADLITDTQRLNWLNEKGLLQHLFSYKHKTIRDFIDENILLELK